MHIFLPPGGRDPEVMALAGDGARAQSPVNGSPSPNLRRGVWGEVSPGGMALRIFRKFFGCRASPEDANSAQSLRG